MIINERYCSVVYGMSITELEKFLTVQKQPLKSVFAPKLKGKEPVLFKEFNGRVLAMKE